MSPISSLKRGCVHLALLVLFTCGVRSVAADSPSEEVPAADIRVGAAAVNLECDESMVLAGMIEARYCADQEGELRCVAVVVEKPGQGGEGSNKLAIVACDVLWIPRHLVDAALADIERTTGIPPANVLVNATHTHHAPSTAPAHDFGVSPEFCDKLRRGIVQSVEEANENLAGGESNLFFFLGEEKTVGGNSRLKLPDGNITWINPLREAGENPQPTGPFDPQLPVLDFRDPTGQTRALVFNHSTHTIGTRRPNVRSPSFYGLAAQELEEELGGVVSFLEGASGSTHNITAVPVADAVVRMKQAVLSAREQASVRPVARLAAIRRPFRFRVRTFDEAEEEVNVSRYTTRYVPDSSDYIRQVFANMREQLRPQQGQERETWIQAMLIGDVAIVGVPAEYFTALGVDIKRRSPFGHTYVAELANDWVGYLPDHQGHGLGGYQTWMGLHSYAEVGTGERMADEVVALLDELAAEDTSDATAAASADSVFDELRRQYQQRIAAVLKEYCLDCHSTDAHEGELDLERFALLDDVRRDPPAWQKLAEMLASGEMPPEDSPQPTDVEMTQLSDWTDRYLDAEARAAAGDPGPVVLRRLNNAEYTYTVGDLTDVPLSPAREFPVDGAAGEGFTNTGSALSMSPSLVSKYLGAGKEIANHAVLLPDGMRFSPSTTRRDWTNEIMASIRSIYLRHTGRVGDANSLNRWDVTDPTRLTDTDGRVDLETYFAVLLRERERVRANIDAVEDIAREEDLSAPYLRRLAEMLSTNDPSSSLLSRVRHRFDAAAGDDANRKNEDSRADAARSIAAEIRSWQERLWTFNPVGHFGRVKPWQEAVAPLVATQSFRVELEPSGDSDEIKLHLVTGSAGDASGAETVVWQSPRIERSGRSPILLRDLRATSVALQRMSERALPDTAKYLAAAFEAHGATSAVDVAELAEAHDIDPIMLHAWLAQLGIDHGDDVTIKEYLHAPLTGLAGHDFVNGWMLPGVGDLSLTANASDEKVNVPGDLNPHAIAVHPRPERWVAVGWKSPMTGRVRLAASAKDAHAACGNGVSWSFELRRRSQRRVLGSGNVELGGVATIEPIEDFAVQQGDLVSLVISARDQNHGCDLTEIDLSINQLDADERRWSLTGDCADSIQAGNPHADLHGNAGVWHFYTGLDDGADAETDVPPDSLLARWLEAEDAQTADAIAAQITTLVSGPPTEALDEADAALHRQLTALDGSLFSRIDTAALAESLPPGALAEVKHGLDPTRFGRHPDPAVTVAGEHLVVTAPSIVTFTMPKALVAGAEFVTTAVSGDTAAQQASTQLLVTTEPPPSADVLLWGVPVVVNPGSDAEARFRQSFDDFREIFPAAMCYPRIVPVDVVVTLVLHHREDKELSRLMLTADESAELDRLWDQLHYVSQDALAIVTGFEQLLEFASQDDDPSKYEPLGDAIRAEAEAFRQRLVETEPRHLDALVDFAARAYRRPLADDEVAQLRRLYADLRTEELSHDEALRLTLARVLTAPAFLYRLERPGQGGEATPVSGNELASRLSYFLWSTAPDAELSRLAASGELLDTEVLSQQTERMLHDDRVRRLAIEFACQWLHVRQFDELAEKSDQYFPKFADLRGDMYEETVRFFTDLFQHDGSLLDVLGADHTFLNERLAGHYGVPNVTGDEWRRVDGVGRFARGGILTQATTLAAQSGASRTSPILRGNWVSETLLGERSPRPPKDVPVLSETVPVGLTERQMIERHSSDASCAKCHARIDPYGFALEAFDAIGRYRENDAGNHPIDTHTTLVDGAEIDGIEGLRQYLLTTRRHDVLRQMCRKLLGYALGRAVRLSDEPLLGETLVGLEENEYRFSTAARTIILSKQFRMIRGHDYRDGAVVSVGEPLERGTATVSTVDSINTENNR